MWEDLQEAKCTTLETDNELERLQLETETMGSLGQEPSFSLMLYYTNTVKIRRIIIIIYSLFHPILLF